MTEKENTNVNPGDLAEDRISGFKGVVVAVTEWLHACRRITIQPQEIKDGKMQDAHTFDEPQVRVLEKSFYFKDEEVEAPVPEAQRTGGPSIAPTRAADPLTR